MVLSLAWPWGWASVRFGNRALTPRSLSQPLHSVGPVSGPWRAPWALPLTALVPALQQLQLLGRWCQEQGIPFPPISPSAGEQQQPGECHSFLDPDCPEAPAVLHFPLVDDSFQEYSAPGEPPTPPPAPPHLLAAP